MGPCFRCAAWIVRLRLLVSVLERIQRLEKGAVGCADGTWRSGDEKN